MIAVNDTFLSGARGRNGTWPVGLQVLPSAPQQNGKRHWEEQKMHRILCGPDQVAGALLCLLRAAGEIEVVPMSCGMSVSGDGCLWGQGVGSRCL